MAARGAIVHAVGMMTAIGAGAKQTATSVRAGVARLTESAIHDRRFQPMVVATVPEEELPPLEPAVAAVPGLTSRQMRMLRLAGPALREAVADLPDATAVPLFLAMPEPLPGRPDPAGERFLGHLAAQSGVRFAAAASRLFPCGRAAGFAALEAGLAALASGTAEHALVGGVDTFVDLYLLGVLDAESRVLGEGVMDGFVPGEGAAFLLLSAGGAPRPGGAADLARVAAVATGEEKGHRYSKEPYRGEGLAATFQALWERAGADLPPVRTVYAGLNGENFGAKEWGTAQLRSAERFADDFRLEHPVDCFGDPGAALGPVLLGLAALGLHGGHLEAPCLVWCSSDRAERGAALLRRVE